MKKVMTSVLVFFANYLCASDNLNDWLTVYHNEDGYRAPPPSPVIPQNVSTKELEQLMQNLREALQKNSAVNRRN